MNCVICNQEITEDQEKVRGVTGADGEIEVWRHATCEATPNNVVDMAAAQKKIAEAENLKEAQQAAAQSMQPRPPLPDSMDIPIVPLLEKLLGELKDAPPGDNAGMLIVIYEEHPRVLGVSKGQEPEGTDLFDVVIARTRLADKDISFLTDYLKLQVMTRYSGVR